MTAATNDYVSNYERVLGQTAMGNGEEVRFVCPFPGCTGYTKQAFCVNLRTGLWCCHHCQQQVEGKEYRSDGAAGHGGTAQDFARMMGDNAAYWPKGELDIDLPKVEPLSEGKRKQLWTTLFEECSLAEHHRDQLRARGIDGVQAGYVSVTTWAFNKLREQFGDEVMIRGGLAYEKEGELHPRQCVQTGRILIPYREKEKVTYFVGYARCPEQRPGQTEEQYAELKSRWAKTCGPAGYTPKVYGTAPAYAEYVIITEGQIKTEAARQRGFPCIGISGIGMSHKLAARHCARQQVKRAIILFDSQLEDQDLVEHEAKRLARELLKEGVPTYHAELPREDGEEGVKADIDSFLLTHTASQLAEVLAAAGSRPYELEIDPPAEEEEPDVETDADTAEGEVALG